MNTSNVYANKYAPYPNEIECLKNFTFIKVRVEKLKATKFGSWQLAISKINCEHFDSKDSLDKIFMDEEFELKTVPPICGRTIEKISIKNALKQFNIEFSCNMSYYFTNQDEIEKDLCRKLDSDLNSILNNKMELKRLEQELFYRQMCKLFGQNDADANANTNNCIQQLDNCIIYPEDTVYEKAFVCCMKTGIKNLQRLVAENPIYCFTT
jgi:hypothetical protein